MKFQEWFEKDGMDYEICLGLTGDERIMAEKAWKACKAECVRILKSNIINDPDYSQEQCNFQIEDVADTIEEMV